MVFDAAWFARHQRMLLWLLNTPFISRWFKWVLCIRRSDLGYQRLISRIYPHAYEVENADGSRTIEIRTHAKYAKRLYYAFLWFWVVWHWWDVSIANRVTPAWNLGFDVLRLFPDANPEVHSWDGHVNRFPTSDTFSFLRNSTSADGLITGSDNSTLLEIQLGSHTTTDRYNALRRMVTLFDTGNIPSSAVITAANLNLFLEAKSINLGSTVIDVVSSNVQSNTGYTNSDDWTTFGTTSFGATGTISGLTTLTYVSIALDANGRSQIIKGGISKFGYRLKWDTDDNFTGTWVSGTSTSAAFTSADAPGTSSDPYLQVTFTPNVNMSSVRHLNRKARAGHSVSSPGGYF